MGYPKTVPGVGLVAGKFSDGDVAQGIPASLDTAAWANAVTDELLSVITAAGLVPNEGTTNQLLYALSAIRGQQRFSSNGTFTVPAGVTKIYVSGVAGGGGGGGSGGATATSGYAATGGGGGGGNGMFVINQPYAVTPGQVLNVTIGAGGVGGVAGAVAGNGGIGGVGGNTTLSGAGVSLTLSGGSGGAPSGGISGVNATSPPGSPGSAAAGPGSYAVSVASYGYNFGGQGGRGADCPFGPGGAPELTAVGNGGGGGGANGVLTSGSIAGRLGATGAAGLLIIEY